MTENFDEIDVEIQALERVIRAQVAKEIQDVIEKDGMLAACVVIGKMARGADTLME